MTYFFAITLAFCSIIYELLLGQTLSAFLGDTVLRYSVTIGLYMFSMGLGALLALESLRRKPLMSLQIVELLLSLIGGFSVFSVFVVSYLFGSSFLTSAFAHSLIVLIGLLSGLEIPLLIEIKRLSSKGKDANVLGFDYLGAFLGTIIFAFWFYPQLGIVLTSFIIAFLNSIVGLGLCLMRYQKSRLACAIQLILGAIITVSMFNSESISDSLLSIYLN